MRPTRTCVVHGNTLTAAAVSKNVLALLAALSGEAVSYERGTPVEGREERGGSKVFLTGPTSKVAPPLAPRLRLLVYGSHA